MCVQLLWFHYFQHILLFNSCLFVLFFFHLPLFEYCPCPNARHLIITECNNCEQTRILTLKSRAISYINGVFFNRSLPRECQTYLRNCQEWYHASSTGWVIWEQVTLTYVTETVSYRKYRLMKDRSKLKLVLQPPPPFTCDLHVTSPHNIPMWSCNKVIRILKLIW